MRFSGFKGWCDLLGDYNEWEGMGAENNADCLHVLKPPPFLFCIAPPALLWARLTCAWFISELHNASGSGLLWIIKSLSILSHMQLCLNSGVFQALTKLAVWSLAQTQTAVMLLNLLAIVMQLHTHIHIQPRDISTFGAVPSHAWTMYTCAVAV